VGSEVAKVNSGDKVVSTIAKQLTGKMF